MSRTTYKLSSEGLKKVEKNRIFKGWGRTSKEWCDLGMSSESTLKRFLKGESISAQHFKNLCNAVGIEEWQKLVDWDDVDSTKVVPETQKSLITKNITSNNSTSDENSSSKYGLAVTGVFSADKKLEIETALEAVRNLLLSCHIVMKPQKDD
ncbi:MAG: hypothetical protein QNJ63_09965 [Calothrix sp. MO_192.B10]|nr:hypothetical protein [Calothrix sp. MO_192.B10]